MKFLVINGPNLNMLGIREKEIYGTDSLQDIISHTEEKILALQDKGFPFVSLEWFQSNSEGIIIDKIHSMISSMPGKTLEKSYDALVINPGAYTHTSLAIYDALKILEGIPIVEVHLTNVYKREENRHSMLTAKASDIIMMGLGRDSYFLAIFSQIIKLTNLQTKKF